MDLTYSYSDLPETFLLRYFQLTSYQEIRTLSFTCNVLHSVLTKIICLCHLNASRILGKDTKDIRQTLQEYDPSNWKEDKYLSVLKEINVISAPIQLSQLRNNSMFVKVILNSSEENEKRVIDYIYDNRKLDMIPFIFPLQKNSIDIIRPYVNNRMFRGYFREQKKLMIVYRSQLR